MELNVFQLPVFDLPVVNVSTDPLDLLLTGLGLRLIQLSKTNDRFKASIKKDFTFQIMTTTGIARHFIFNAGTVTSVQGASGKPDFSLIFSNSEKAVKTLVKGDPTAFMTGMQTGDIKMEGDFGLLVWFNSIAKMIPPKIPKPVLVRIKWAQEKIEDARARFGI